MISKSFLKPAVAAVVAALIFQACSEDRQAPAQDAQEELVELQITIQRPMGKVSLMSAKAEPANLEPNFGRPRPPFMVPVGTRLLSLGASVSASGEPISGHLEKLTDGDKEACLNGFAELGPGPQWVQVDLGQTYELQAIVFWQCVYLITRIYRDVIVRVSDDKNFTEYVELFNNDHDDSSGLGAGSDYEYLVSIEGKLVDAKGARARYVRVYSNGNSCNEYNHFIEVEVYGR